MNARWTTMASVALLALAAPAHADVRGQAVVSAMASTGVRGTPFAVAGTSRIPLVVETPGAASGDAPGLVFTSRRFATLVATADEIEALSAQHPDWRFSWSPPRHTLLDQTAMWVGSTTFHERTGNAGQGALVAIIDTGIDPAHGDFREADGSTRIAWLIDFSRPPRGSHPELEERYGCTGEGRQCAIFSRADITQVLGSNVAGDQPRDVFGHGTHVASLAVGNGQSMRTPFFIGSAPEADLVVARVTRGASNSILDGDILVATRFAFDRADEMGLPMVVNLSLGSDFGPHDGNSSLERGLSDFVGAEHPGRAVVVAAGNSGTLFVETEGQFPEPLGSHTEVHVTRSSSVRVPILTPNVDSAPNQGTVFIWLAFGQSDQISVGLDDRRGKWVAPLAPGEARAFDRDGLTATIFNGSEKKNSPVPSGSAGAAVVLTGQWPAGETFAVRLEGKGNVGVWVQSEGDFSVAGGNALVPRATKQGTINVPASSPALIAVGATVNRDTWSTHNRKRVTLESSVPDAMPFFSSSGPNALGVMKPDIVAPGVFLIGAMGVNADPRENAGGVFEGINACPDGDQCLVVSDTHAVTSGTSMAAPVVAGAVALLFARDPTLTQDEVRALLQAGARRPTGMIPVEQQLGPGALDLLGTLTVMDSEQSPIRKDPVEEESWVALSQSFARPGGRPLFGTVELRGADGAIADGFDESRLRLEAEPAIVHSSLTRVAPGLWRFELAAPGGTGGQRMSVRLLFDGALFLERDVPIAVDQAAAEVGFASRGGCTIVAPRSAPAIPWAAWFLAALGITVARGRACVRVARTARRRGRKGGRG